MTIKELLPDLTSEQRIKLGDFIKGVPFIITTGYKREDSNKVRTYSNRSYDIIVLQAIRLFRL